MFSRLLLSCRKVRYASQYAWGTELEDAMYHSSSLPVMTQYANYQDVLQARTSLVGLPATPLDKSSRLSQLMGAELWLKKDNVNKTGSYKIRGAIAKVAAMSKEEKERGVVVPSSGNFGIAMAYACSTAGVSCTVVFPAAVYHTQVKSCQKLNAKTILSGETWEETCKFATKIATDSNAILVEAHGDKDVVAGYGSLALEVLAQNPYLDALILPVSGSLLATTAMVVGHINPRIQIFGVETENSNSLHEKINGPDSLRGGVYDILRSHVKEVLFVDEADRSVAMLQTMEAEKMVVQGAGISAVASCLSNKSFAEKFKGASIAAVCTGGNIESSLLGTVIDKALVHFHRVARIKITAFDNVNSVAGISSVLSDFRANILQVSFERAFVERVGYANFLFTIEIKGHDHLDEIMAEMNKKGYEKVQIEEMSR